VAAWERLAPDVRQVVIREASGKTQFNKQETDSIEWACWSWNPITGCLHDCAYCYARDIANRFYPQGFVPTFVPERLTAPANTAPEPELGIGGQNVFVVSMGDLFGKWVPEDWITAIFDQVRGHPEWNFLFLTKFPQRLAEREWPMNAWCGTTVDTQARVKIAEKAFRDVKAGVRWLSVEPMMERLTFTALDMFNWVVLGGATASTQTPAFDPPFEWVLHLLQQVEAAKIPHVYAKANLRALRGHPFVSIPQHV
jgi:protein gp37